MRVTIQQCGHWHTLPPVSDPVPFAECNPCGTVLGFDGRRGITYLSVQITSDMRATYRIDIDERPGVDWCEIAAFLAETLRAHEVMQ